jgi:hypothetical protein
MKKITTVKTTCSQCGRPVSAGGNIQPPEGRVVCLWCAIGGSGARREKLGIDRETRTWYNEYAYHNRIQQYQDLELRSPHFFCTTLD